MYDEDFETLLLDDGSWWLRLVEGLRLLADNDPNRPTLWPVDDFIAEKKYVPRPPRGTHATLGEGWMGWGDGAGGERRGGGGGGPPVGGAGQRGGRAAAGGTGGWAARSGRFMRRDPTPGSPGPSSRWIRSRPAR